MMRKSAHGKIRERHPWHKYQQAPKSWGESEPGAFENQTNMAGISGDGEQEGNMRRSSLDGREIFNQGLAKHRLRRIWRAATVLQTHPLRLFFIFLKDYILNSCIHIYRTSSWLSKPKIFTIFWPFTERVYCFLFYFNHA